MKTRLSLVYAQFTYFGFILILLFLALQRNPNNLGGIGGAFILVPVTFAIIVIPILRTGHFRSTFRFSVLLILVLLINHLKSNVDNDKLDITYHIILFVGSMISLLFVSFHELLRHVKKPEELSVEITFTRKMFILTIISPVLISTPFICITMVAFIKVSQYTNHTTTAFSWSWYLNLTTWIMMEIIVGLFFQVIYLLRFRDSTLKKLLNQSGYLVSKRTMRQVRWYFVFGGVLLIIIGSLLEILRGQWLMWWQTVAIVSLLSAAAWKVHKNRFKWSCEVP